MTNRLIQRWNSSPPPSAHFLKELARWRKASTATGLDPVEARGALIEAITTPQDLAQFLFERAQRMRCDIIENETVGRYWDALAGVLVEDAERADPNCWSTLARMLDKALYYE